MAAAYLFLNYNYILTYEICFSDQWEQPQGVSSKIFFVVFIPRISHYGKITTLHKLISIVVQLTDQIE